MTGSLNDYDTAVRLRDAVTKIAQAQVPASAQFATVESVDRTNRVASVIMANDTQAVTVRFLADDGPYGNGDIVEVANGRIQRMIYSITAAGGVYISPVMINQVFAALNGELFRQNYVSNLGKPNLGNAWYIGRWRNQSGTSASVSIWISQDDGTAVTLAEYDIEIVRNHTNGSWVTVIPTSKTVSSSGILDFALEISVGLDPVTSMNMLDIRIRELSNDTSANAFRFEMDLHGNWVRDSTLAESLVSMPPVTVGNFNSASITTPRSAWDYVGQIGSPVFQNGWLNFDGGYELAPAGALIDAKGKVRLRGMVMDGSSVIFQLPEGYRPDFNLIFDGLTGNIGGQAEIRIDTMGNVTVTAFNTGGYNGYVSLDKISFFPANTVTYTNILASNLLHGWVIPGTGGYAPPRYYIDSDGIVHWSGVVAAGATGTVVTLPTVAMCDLNGEMFCQPCLNGIARVDINSAGFLSLFSYGTNGGNGYLSLDGIEYTGPNHSLFWHTSNFNTYPNDWVAYTGAAGWNPGRFCIDSAGIVRFGGLVSSGTIGLSNAILTAVPATFKSNYDVLVSTIAGGYIARLQSLTDQVIAVAEIGASATNAYVSLAPLKYSIA